MPQSWKLVIHGGAGVITRKNLKAGMERAILRELTRALQAGAAVLKAGGAALDAAEAAVCAMEDSELFNAGRGSVFNAAGEHEMEASVMDGSRLTCGSVFLTRSLRNPVRAARLVMEKTPHVALDGPAAEKLAIAHGLALEGPEYFHTERRWKALEKVRALEAGSPLREEDRHGTVGAVARDVYGHIAAATSTGGTTSKMKGRIGDTPVIGASTWADDASCGVSTTGQGEFFIRLATARDMAALVEYKGMSASEAAREVIGKLGKLGGNGGLIGIDRNGDIAMEFNSEGMYRGYATADGHETLIFR